MKKFNLSTVASFLGHHVHDLNAIGNVLEGVVAALPINAETRANINKSIERVRDSAENVEQSLRNLGIIHDPEPADRDAIMRKMVEDYMKAHPVQGAPVAQAAAEDKTADNNADNQPKGTTNQQQVEQEGKGATPGAKPKGDTATGTGTK